MDNFLQDARFDYLSRDDKAFILAFDGEMARLGYDFGGKIGSGYCWGRHMLIYTKSGVKSKNVYARVYLRDTCIVLRMFFSKIDDQRAYIENAPAYIKEVFTGEHGMCQHCHNKKADGTCMFRKSYTLDGRLIEKCSGVTFEFHDPNLRKLDDYIALFGEFYPRRAARSKA
jgi:hypothetical protein